MTQVLHRSARAEGTGYLLRAGTDTHVRASEEVLGRFATEAEARQAFLALRLSPAYRHGWAEVVAVGDNRPPTPLCWFGDRAPSGTAINPFHRKSPVTTRSRGVQIENRGGIMQTKELEPIAAPAPDLDRRRRVRRSRVLGALVAVLAAATLAIGAATGNRDDPPNDRPVPTWHVVPAEPTDLPYYGSTADG